MNRIIERDPSQKPLPGLDEYLPQEEQIYKPNKPFEPDILNAAPIHRATGNLDWLEHRNSKRTEVANNRTKNDF